MIETGRLVNILDELSVDIANRWPCDDGGWAADSPRGRARDGDVWTTAQAILWLIEFDAHKFQRQIDRGMQFLAITQHVDANPTGNPTGQADGGWGWRIDKESESTATSLALLAHARAVKSGLVRAGTGLDRHLARMKHARDWLVRHVNADGGFSLLPSPHSSAYGTCWGTLALNECIGLQQLEDPRIRASMIIHALALVEASRAPDGGWGETISQPSDAIGTAYLSYLLIEMERMETAQHGLNWLRRNQSDDGSWEPGPAQSVVEATAWAVTALLRGGTDPSSPRIESALNYLLAIQRQQEGWPGSPHAEPQLWANYYVCLALAEYIKASRQPATQSAVVRPSLRGTKVFIVHGHNHDIRERAKQAVASVGFEPVVLDELPSLGMSTLIEKFEHYAKQEGVDFALILCTQDDMDSSEGAMVPRGNVLIELGWFVARLSRRHVIVAADGPIKLPSDLAGIVTIDLRSPDWMDKVKRELDAITHLS